MKSVQTDYAELRAALAMGPTPGPWEIKDGRTDTIENAQGYPVCTVHYHPNERYGHGSRAAYIAACDPDTIRELFTERDQMSSEIEALREALRVMVEMVETDGFVWDYAMDVARAALAQKQEEV